MTIISSLLATMGCIRVKRVSFCFLLLVACCACSAPANNPRNGILRGGQPTRDIDSAATLRGGIQDTAGAGSSHDPDILELASVKELAEMQQDLSKLNELFEKIGATFYLEQSREITVFMPTNTAFKNAPVDVLNLPWEKQWRILQYHIVPNNVIRLENLDSGTEEHSTWEGTEIRVSRTSSRRNPEYRVNEIARVVGSRPTIETFNGVSYKIDTILIPFDMDIAGLREEVAEAEAMASPNAETASADPSAVASHEVDTMTDEQDTTGNENAVDATGDKQGTPQFVQDINLEHSYWNESPSERAARLREEYNRAATEAGMDIEAERDKRDPARSTGGLAGLLDSEESPNENGGSVDESDSSTEETAGVLSTGRIHSLAVLDGSGVSFPPIEDEDGHAATEGMSVTESAVVLTPNPSIAYTPGLLPSSSTESAAVYAQSYSQRPNRIGGLFSRRSRF